MTLFKNWHTQHTHTKYIYQNTERIKADQKKRVNNDDDNEYIKMFKLFVSSSSFITLLFLFLPSYNNYTTLYVFILIHSSIHLNPRSTRNVERQNRNEMKCGWMNGPKSIMGCCLNVTWLFLFSYKLILFCVIFLLLFVCFHVLNWPTTKNVLSLWKKDDQLG